MVCDLTMPTQKNLHPTLTQKKEKIIKLEHNAAIKNFRLLFMCALEALWQLFGHIHVCIEQCIIKTMVPPAMLSHYNFSIVTMTMKRNESLEFIFLCHRVMIVHFRNALEHDPKTSIHLVVLTT